MKTATVTMLLFLLLAIFITNYNGIDTDVSKRVYNDDFDWLWLGDTLELLQQDDKCGEWGGDIERIKIFWESEKWKSRKLLGYYIKEAYNCDTLSRVGYMYDEAIPTIYQSKEIELTNQQIELLKEVIMDLTEHKLNNHLPFGHSGIVNIVRVKGKDSISNNLYIRDYPSFRWNKFHKLKNEILKHNE